MPHRESVLRGGALRKHYQIKQSDNEIIKNAEIFWKENRERIIDGTRREAPDASDKEVKEMFLSTFMSTHKKGAARDRMNEIYGNSIYLVYVDRNTPLAYGELEGKVTHLSIKRKDKRPCNDWRDFQEIKNELCGEEWEAMQIYPAESRMTDTSNQYHLWCTPPDLIIPVGWKTREVLTKDVNPKQGPIGQRYRGRK